MQFDQNFAQTVKQYDADHNRDTDLLADDFDPIGINMMSGLNELDPYRQKLESRGGNPFNMQPNPTPNMNKFNPQMREGRFMKEDKEKYYPQKNFNKEKQIEERNRRSRSRSVNKGLKQKHMARKNLGILISYIYYFCVTINIIFSKS